ncbi:MAG: hypothetical protein HOO97_01060 [Sideroxydans sp.]|nr:hypothetical protein [Sideroxydans sp.]
MNKLNVVFMKALRRLFRLCFKLDDLTPPMCEVDPDKAGEIISKALTCHEPKMIARFGSTELLCMSNYMGVISEKHNWIEYIRGKSNPWWWNQSIINQMQMWSGFFPADVPSVEKFCQMMIEEARQLDVLGSWLPAERIFLDESVGVALVNLELLNPYFSSTPWTRALEEKKVLVIHPFASTIESQYKKRELIFKDNLLPAFELKTIKAVQSIAGEKTDFETWFDALDHMKAQMDGIDYDICLIGCGAYGFPLAAHAKRMGKKGFHLGGSLQLLFGIRGKRWENPNYNPDYNFSILMNEHWVKPGEEERPKDASKVEGACYW